jgi:hypothetical protein
MLACSFVVTGCSTKTTLGAVVRKQIVCVEEQTCKQALAKDCPRGGVLHGATPAVVIDYSCNP